MHAPSPRKYVQDLPRDLENVTLKCLEKEPARRYADCQALADDLRRWLEGEPVTARRPGAAERFARWSRKNPAASLLAAAVLLTFALGMATTTGMALVAQKNFRNAREREEFAQRQVERAERERQAARDAEAQ